MDFDFCTALGGLQNHKRSATAARSVPLCFIFGFYSSLEFEASGLMRDASAHCRNMTMSSPLITVRLALPSLSTSNCAEHIASLTQLIFAQVTISVGLSWYFVEKSHIR